MSSKTVEIQISAEFENDVLVALLATSSDLERLNRKILETVRFKFVEKRFFIKKPNAEDVSNTLQEEVGVQKFYPSEHELLEDILSKKNVRHFRQLRYLADNHAQSILKLRFVFHPFFLCFLVVGKSPNSYGFGNLGYRGSDLHLAFR